MLRAKSINRVARVGASNSAQGGFMLEFIDDETARVFNQTFALVSLLGIHLFSNQTTIRPDTL